MTIEQEIEDIIRKMRETPGFDELLKKAVERYEAGFPDLDIDLETAVRQMAKDDLEEFGTDSGA